MTHAPLRSSSPPLDRATLLISPVAEWGLHADVDDMASIDTMVHTRGRLVWPFARACLVEYGVCGSGNRMMEVLHHATNAPPPAARICHHSRTRIAAPA